jgi:hypothetical protein
MENYISRFSINTPNTPNTPRTPKKHFYRPVSYTESDLTDLRKSFLTDDNISLETKQLNAGTQTDAQIQDIQIQDIQTEKVYKHFEYVDSTEMIINKLILFFIHLFLITMFELVFFFNYVTKFEDTALVSVFSSITNKVTDTCSRFDNTTKIIIDDIFKMFINTTQTNQDAVNADNSRKILNNKLFMNAILYFIGVSVFNILLVSLNKIYCKRKINYKGIMVDNTIMIILLGMYEYIFFSNIVFKYITITPEELTLNIENNFLENC